MLNKVAYRNAKRSISDYFVYLITMIVISALMFSFDAMIFSKDIAQFCKEAGVMAAMIGLATFFIIFVVAWLINYMVKFMMEKKSREFGVYLLIGMKKKEVSSLFIKENAIIGILAFLLGIIPGIFLKQIFTSIFYSIFNEKYSLKVEFSVYSFLLTFVLFLGSYFIALIRNKRKIKKMTINEMMSFGKKNDELKEKGVKIKSLLFIVAIAYFIYFDVRLANGKFSILSIWGYLLLLILAIYFFYLGISSIVIMIINRGGQGIYKRDRLFIIRQFASKLKTMRFTMTVLTILFVFSILGTTIAMMFNDYLDKQLGYTMPFDVMVFSDKASDNFKDYNEILDKNTKVKERLAYNIYENGTNNINKYLAYKNKVSYKPSKKRVDNETCYFDYDTFMKLSDYNKLRKMAGYKEVSLSNDGFIVHSKERVKPFLKEYFKSNILKEGNNKLKLEGYYDEGFAQSGQNGADYIIVIPDKEADNMKAFYSVLAADIKGKSTTSLQDKLDKVRKNYDSDENLKSKITWGFGTDEILAFSDPIIVKDTMENDMKFVLSAISFPFIYIALVFVCVSLTILSVQQISDSIKYKFRYSVLNKLGVKNNEIDNIILKQLFVYYLVPLIVSIAISAVMSLFMGSKFIYYTGVKSHSFMYFGFGVGVLLVIYAIYFAVTYVQFKRNVKA